MPQVDLQKNDADKWLDTAQFLRRLAESIPPTDWVPDAKTSKDPYLDEDERHAARVAVLETFSEVAQEYINGAQSLLRGQLLPVLSEPAKFWLHTAIYQSAIFCRHHVCKGVDEGRVAISPYPPDSRLRFGWRLLTEWWLSAGLQMTVQLATTDQNLYYLHVA